MESKIIKMDCQDEHFRHLLLFADSKAAKAARDVYAVYGEGAIAERTAFDWYAMFKNGNFDLKAASHSGRRVEFDEERLNQLLQNKFFKHKALSWVSVGEKRGFKKRGLNERIISFLQTMVDEEPFPESCVVAE
ncbi:uncharacterized protein LOC115219439 [Octopus sinensis]|uniref:Uncharacterized protein LOC115219439 n=1 Tax=Octopus sinensis TaxID=2607531 RepID=A0A6P7T3T4_9MOLL|nr:uncharacterized protein LOC115219439 [Octopus sinensis]